MMEQTRDWNASADAQAVVPVPGSASTIAVHGGLFFVSSIAGVRESGSDSIEAELRDAFRRLRTALRAAGASLGDAVQLTVAVRCASDIPALDAVTAEFFQKPYPARVVTGAPNDAPISVSAIAVRGADPDPRTRAARDVKETLI
jgi:enamine deaminase RidA (YjgF/YER057c/UK114 family)